MSDNIDTVRKQIEFKQGSKPFYSTANYTESVVTDIDHFPYTRFYRGVYYEHDPIVFEREAGWRSPNNFCYNGSGCCRSPVKHEYCWQTPCSTILPCYPPKQENSYLNLNKTCINTYQ